MVQRDGEALTARRCRVGQPAIARALAGLGLRAGTAELIRAGVERAEAELARSA